MVAGTNQLISLNDTGVGRRKRQLNQPPLQSGRTVARISKPGEQLDDQWVPDSSSAEWLVQRLRPRFGFQYHDANQRRCQCLGFLAAPPVRVQQ